MPEITGIGVDLCGIARMEELILNERFMQRCFSENERRWLQEKGKAAAQSLAGMWAAKEAFAKALKTGLIFPMTDLEIIHDENGAPSYCPRGKAAELLGERKAHLSISHEADTAVAFCVLETAE